MVVPVARSFRLRSSFDRFTSFGETRRSLGEGG
jgi:hypothetical protein